MRKITIAIALLAALVVNSGRAEAATLQLVLNPDGDKDIDIVIPDFPGEFGALDSSWGRLTYNGALVAYYVFSREDKIHAGNQLPSNYPNPWFTLIIRTIGAPSELLILQGAARPLAEGGGSFGGVTVGTGALAFLRDARFTLAAGVLTLTY